MYNNADKKMLSELKNFIDKKTKLNVFELKMHDNGCYFLENKFLKIYVNDLQTYIIYTITDLKIEFHNKTSIYDFIVCNIPDDCETDKFCKYHNIFYKK